MQSEPVAAVVEVPRPIRPRLEGYVYPHAYGDKILWIIGNKSAGLLPSPLAATFIIPAEGSADSERMTLTEADLKDRAIHFAMRLGDRPLAIGDLVAFAKSLPGVVEERT